MSDFKGEIHMASIGKNIKLQRKKLNMSQDELAAKIFTTRQTISNYENDKSNPNIETLEILAAALDTDIMCLLYGEQNSPEKKLKTTVKHLSIGVTILAVVVIILFKLLGFSGVIGLLLYDQLESKVIINTDIDAYQNYIGETANKEYRNKFDMDESIFPQSIPDTTQVEDYKMVYYNPWDAQYLSYLVIQYDQGTYDLEVERLKKLSINEYEGYYGVTGFNEKYELLAMNADPSYGFIYAISDGIGKIIYVEILFCNYFMDLEYEEYISSEYLPVGFDASVDNEYREYMLNR